MAIPAQPQQLRGATAKRPPEQAQKKEEDQDLCSRVPLGLLRPGEGPTLQGALCILAAGTLPPPNKEITGLISMALMISALPEHWRLHQACLPRCFWGWPGPKEGKGGTSLAPEGKHTGGLGSQPTQDREGVMFSVQPELLC